MIDLIPTVVDGAVVFNLRNSCPTKSMQCETCPIVSIYFHNWIKISQIEYIVFDFMDEKDICPVFLEEIQQLRKRIQIPFLFSGVMHRPREVLEQFNYSERYPIFVTPEDAVRAVRMQHPGLTETVPKLPLIFGQSLLSTLRNHQAETGISLF